MLITQNAAEAEEAAQDAFVKAWRALKRFRTGEPLRPWLLTIVANEARNRRRSAGRRSALALRAAEPERVEDRSAEAQVIAAESRTALLGALSRAARRRPARARLPLPARALGGRDRGRARRPARHREVQDLARARAPARGGDHVTPDLEHALRELEIDWPATPDIAAAVRMRLDEPQRRRSWLPTGWRMQLAYVAALLLILFAGTMAVSPDARSTVLRWLGISSVEIRKEPPRPLPTGLNLGQPATLDGAARVRGAGADPGRPRRSGRELSHHAAGRDRGGVAAVRRRPDPRADVPRPRDPVHREDDRLRRPARAADRRRRDGVLDRGRARLRVPDRQRAAPTTSSGSRATRCSSTAPTASCCGSRAGSAARARSRSRSQFSDGSGGIVASSA